MGEWIAFVWILNRLKGQGSKTAHHLNRHAFANLFAIRLMTQSKLQVPCINKGKIMVCFEKEKWWATDKIGT